jgi:hypothetical protein
VRCTATDRHGLHAGARFTVRVEAGRVLPEEHSHRSAPHARAEVEPPPVAPRPQGEPRDALAPRLDLPAGVTVQATSPQGAVVRYDATAVDAGDGAVTTSCAPASGSRFAVGRTLVTCSATDRAGNIARGSFAVTVRPVPVDSQPPRLQVPKRVERDAADRSGTVVEYTAKAVDSHDGRVTVDCEPPSGSRFRPGRTTVRCTAADRAGNVARGRFVVLVRTDTAAPRLDLPQAIEREADPDGTVVEYTAKAVDGRDGPVTVTCSPPSGSRFPVGRTTVTCAASDRAGNTAHGSFAVVVREAPAPDRVPPVLTLPKDITAEERDRLGTPVAYRPTATDDRDGPVPVTCAPPGGSDFTLGTTTVRCSAADRAGNTAEGTFTVTVTEPPDTVPPVLELPPDITRTTDSPPIAVDYEPGAEDDRDGPVPVTCDPPSGSRFSRGETTVTCTASDRAGNVATGTFVVTVSPPPPPPPPPPPSGPK